MAPRPHTPKSRGRRNLSASNRQTTPRNKPDDTYQDRPQKKRKGGGKIRVSGVTKAYKKKGSTSSKIRDFSSGGDSSDEADVEDSDDGAEDVDDDDPEPAIAAPSHATKTPDDRAAGPSRYQNKKDPPSEVIANDSDDMFAGGQVTDALLDDDEDHDDEIYQGVDDISDSDPDNVSLKEEAFLEAELNLTMGLGGLDDDEDPSSFYLNQIEGMSAYGFGDNSDADGTVQFHMSSPSSDDDGEARRARFEASFPEQKNVLLFQDSPTMTRALLPSALPHASMAAAGKDRYGDLSDDSSDFDSDVTEDCLPDAAVYASDMEDYIPEESSPSDIAQSKLREGKGPPTGTFIDEGEKSAGTLDATGKMLIITNPHHLGEEFARRYGGSGTPSPGVGLPEVGFGDENSHTTASNLNGPMPDPMPSSLNGNFNLASNGQATGPPEAWYADASLFPGYLDDADTDFEGVDVGEQQKRYKDILKFIKDDEDEDDLITPPDFMSGDVTGTPRDHLSHLNTSNVMAFRRGTDPAFAGFQSSPPAPQRGYFATPKPPRSARKRKKFNDSPYSTPLYRGVTPIQRTARSSYSSVNASDPTSPLKRRKTMV